MKYLYGDTVVWGIPGGSPHDGETLMDALKRELDEELGVSINIEGLIGVVETPSAGKVKHTLHCVFLGKVADGTPAINPEHTSALAVEWIKIEDLDESVLYPPINDVVEQMLTEGFKPQYLGMRKRKWF